MSLFQFIPTVEAAAGGPTDGVTRQADPSTMDKYQEMLDFSESTRYVGRLWSDKTVFAYGYDNDDPDWNSGTNELTLNMEDDGVNSTVQLDADFLHVYSVLGSSQELSENIPVDIVISMDITASMLSTADTATLNGTTGRQGSTDSNLAIALDAVNDLIDQVRAYSPASRIGIVVYWGTGYQMIPFVQGNIEFKGYSLHNGVYANNGGAAIQPVLHYVISDSTTRDDANEDGTKNGYYVYDPVSGNHFRYDDPKADYFNTKYMHYSTQNGGNLQKAEGGQQVENTGNGKNSDLGAGTNIEAGIYTAMRGVADLGLDKGVEYTLANGSKVKREPIVVILSDGGTYHTLVKEDDVDTDSNNNWIDENTTIGGNWWDVSEPQKAAATKYRDGTKEEQSLIYSSGMVADVAAMLQGAYWKAAIANVYGKDVSGVPVYTIGLDVNSLYIGIADKAKNKDDENGSTNPDGNTVFTSPAALNPEYAFGTHGDVNITNTTSATYTFNEFKAAVDKWKAGGNNPIKIQTDLIRSSNGTDWGGFTTGNPGSLQRQSTEYVFKAPSQANQNATPVGDSTFGERYGVEPEQIDLIYTNAYFSAKGTGTTSEGGQSLADAFKDIFTSFTQSIFVPVEGDNDLGVNNAVTFMDPMGKYMEVKDVKGLSLFGTYYNITKTAVYDYQWNNAYMEATGEGAGVSPLPQGWYRGEATADAEFVSESEGLPKDSSGNKYTSADAAWAAGWVFRVNYQTAARFVPTLSMINDPSAADSKERQTVYTFYRLDIDQTDREKLRVNPAYLPTGQSEADYLKGVEYDSSGNGNHTNSKPGVYALADMRIWVEDSGDYNDDHPDLENDANYDEALWVNIPVNMLPLREITIDVDPEGGYTYETNVPRAGASVAANSAESASFPLRIFYTVGVSDEVLENGRVNIAGAIKPEYINQNKITTEAARNARGIDVGNLEFFSNWYNPLKRYSDYVTTRTDYTYGDPVTSFSPSIDNRYYIFEKALPLYSTAYVWVPSSPTGDPTTTYGKGQGNWRKVTINEDGTDEETANFTPTDFGGKLIAKDLDPANVQGSHDERQNSIWDALGKESISQVHNGDMILLKNHRLTDVTKPTGDETDPFSSDSYYFLPIDFFELGVGGVATQTQYLITRKGSEFGSAYTSSKISNGDMLCWHDVTGRITQDYPYLSASVTGDNSRGRDYIGRDIDPDTGWYRGVEKGQAPSDGDKPNEGNKWADANGSVWVVCAKPGGLRVGNLAQSVQAKAGTYATPEDIIDYIKDRFKGEATAESLSWGYYAQNVTRTANNYYLPTISASSGGDASSAVVNVYLGNNGRLYLPDTTLLVTKMIDPLEGGVVDPNQEFNYQVYIAGISGPMDAVVVHYNEDVGAWQRQFHYIDLELDKQLFLQTQDGQKAMVDAAGKQVIYNSTDGNYVYAEGGATYDGERYYVYIGNNRHAAEDLGATDTSFRVYHNNDVDGNGSVNAGDVTVDGTSGSEGTLCAATVWLVSTDKYASDWEGQEVTSVDGHYNSTLNNFPLLTIDPNASTDTTEISISTPYLTASAYWTKRVTFGENANKNDGSAPSGALGENDLYDPIIPSSDRSDYFPSSLTKAEIAKHTAEFTLKHGEALLFSGIPSASVYRVTEKLTDAQLAAGYTLKEVRHNQQVGSVSTYRPGAQMLPVYYKEGYTYAEYGGGAYPHVYDSYTTEKGLMWALDQSGDPNDSTYLHYEPFFHTNAMVWEAYSTMDEKAQGDNHHQPNTVPDGESIFWRWTGTESVNTGMRHTVLDNPSCKSLAEGGCDESIDGGKVLHYFFKDGAMRDFHYQGEGSGYIRNVGRFITSPTVHFLVDGETQEMAETSAPNTKSSTDYVGVYSVFGNTGTFEESVNFVNTIQNDKTETQINGENVTASEEDRNTYPAVAVGDVITYEVKWANTTGSEAQVVIIDPLDEGVDFAEASNGGTFFEEQAKANDFLATIYTDSKNVVTVDSGHVVIWDLGKQAAGAKGTVTLKVKVNEKAPEWWDYDGDGVADKPAPAPENDYLVRNRATVRVADNAYNTNTVVNPVNKPSKTETNIHHDSADKTVNPEDLTREEDQKLHGPTVYPGDEITYEIEWRNYENKPATISIRDPLNPNVEFVSAAFDPAGFDPAPGVDAKYDPSTKQSLVHSIEGDQNIGTAPGYGVAGDESRPAIAYTKADHTVTFNLGVVPAGASGKVTLVARVLDSAPPVGYVDNTAYVTVGQNAEQQTDTIENPTPEEKKTEVTPGDGVMVAIGDQITYQISWQNYKTEAARVIVMDTLDPGVTFENATGDNYKYYEAATILPADGDYDEISIPAHTVVWNLGVQGAQEKGQVTLTVTVNEQAFSKYEYNETADGFIPDGASSDLDYEVLNQARVKVGNDNFILTQIVENPVPDKDESKIEHSGGSVDSDPTLTPKEGADQTVTGPLVHVGDQITYTIHWTNGHDEAANVTISDPLDPGVDFVSADEGGVYDETTHTVTWTLENRDPKGSGIVTLVVKVNEKATPAGIVDNQASVKVNGDPFVKTKTIENPTPQMEKTEIDPGEGKLVKPGDEIDYKISWHNYEVNDADVIITDKLDPGVDFVSAGVNGEALENDTTTIKPETGNLTIMLYGGPGADDSEEITFTLTLTAPDGKTLSPSYELEDSEGTTGTWTASGNTFTLKPGQQMTVKDLPVGTVYSLTANGKDVLKDAVLGAYGSAVTVTVSKETQTLSLPVPPTEPTPEEPTEPTETSPEEPAGDEPQAISNDEESTTDDATDPTEPVPGNQDEDPSGTEPAQEPQEQETVVVYTFSAEVHDYDAPTGDPYGTMPIADSTGFDKVAHTYNGETAALHQTITETDSKTIDIYYYAKAHAVVWVLHDRPANASGDVDLTVRVNEDAEKLWSYDHPEYGPDETTRDDLVRNQAGIKVGDNAEIKTRIIENPTEPKDPDPHKTEVTPGDKSPVKVGDEITYEITWQNYDPEIADVVIRDPLDDGVDFVSADNGGVYDASTHTVTWTFKADPETDGVVSLTVRVNEEAKVAGIVYNQAFVKIGNHPEVATEIPENPLPGGLIVTKTVTGSEGDKTKDFHFTVTFDPTNFDTSKVEITKNGKASGLAITGGTLSFTLKHDEKVEITGLPAGTTYTVTEREADQDGYSTRSTGAEGTIPAGDTAEAAFVNTKPADPDPHKTEVTPGDKSPVKVGDEITYEITWQNYDPEIADVVIRDPLDDGVDFVSADNGGVYDPSTHTVTWTFKADPETDGVVSLTVRVNEEAKVAGIVYNQAFVKVGNHPEVATEIPENPLPGGLIVTKTVTGSEGDKTKDFHFTVTFDPTNFDTSKVTITKNGKASGLTITGGTLSFTLKHDEKLEITGLPADTAYTVTEREANQDGYSTRSTGAEGTIPAGDMAKAAFVNTKPADPDPHKTEVTPGDKSPVKVGDEITYEITWQNYDPEIADVVIRDPLDDGVDFVSADNGGVYDPSTHTVTWTFEADPDTDGVVSLTVRVNEEAKVAGIVYNQAFVKVGNHPEVATEIPENPLPGGLIVTKTVTGSEGDKTKDFHFTVTFDPTNFDTSKVEITKNGKASGLAITGGKLEFDLKDGESVTITGLPAGTTYTVTEQEANQDGYSTRSTGAEGTIPAGDMAKAAFVNTKPKDPDPHKTEVTPGDKSPVKVGDEITYEITWQNYDPEIADVVIRDPLDDGVDFVSADNGGVYDASTHTVTWTFKADPETDGAVSLTVRVNEDAKVAGIVYNQAFVKIGNHPEVATEIPENPLPGGLIVTKTVTGSEGDKTKDFHFTVTFDLTDFDASKVEITKNGDPTTLAITGGTLSFTLKHDEKVEITGLPAGTTYTVTEQEADQDGYSTRSTGAEGTIPAGDTAEAAFVNTKPADPDPHKTEVTPGDKMLVEVGDEITYEITWQNYDPEIADVVIRDPLDDGVDFVSADNGGVYDPSTHTVTWTFKTDPDTDGAVSLTVRVNEEAKVAGIVYNQAFVKIGNHPEVATEIPENPLPGGLIVTKTVTGTAGDTEKEWHFRVELSDKTINGQYGGMFFTDGVAEFTLKHGQSLSATGLPDGITYTVTEFEANQDGYTTRSIGAEGTIQEGKFAEARFINGKDRTPPPPTTPTGSTTPTTPDDSPKTGDSSNLGLWLPLLIVSLIGAAATFVAQSGIGRKAGFQDRRRKK